MPKRKPIPKQKETSIPKFKKYIALFKFFGIFIVVIAAYYSIVLIFSESVLEPYINFNAKLAGGLLSLLGNNIVVKAADIISPTFVISLSFGCEGSETIIIFFAGVLAFPILMKYKFYGLLAGGVILYLLNLIRIILLFYIGIYFTKSFDTFHAEIFPVLFIVISIITWALWLKWSTKKLKQSSTV